MLRRFLIFSGVVVWAWFVYVQGHQLLLAFYVLFPFFLFPLFHFFNSEDYIGFNVVSLVIVGLYGVFLFHQRTLEMLGFGAGYAGAFLTWVTYRNFWVRQMQNENIHAKATQNELDSLNQKYHSRLESLHHLEKQVASLLDLFEIARDFSESLSFEAMSEILFKKVSPILPFREMKFILLAPEKKVSFSACYGISSQGMQSLPPEFDETETNLLYEVLQSKQMIKKTVQAPLQEEQWIFPLVMEGEVTALLEVFGGSNEDFVKFEVLVAHLVLQVKKIRLYETVKELSIIDGLTGLYMRRHFLERFHEELKRSVKYHHPLAVLMLDIDHFKRYNDEFGHLVGDATLKEVASVLRSSLRKVDIVARYGGEEFIAVLPETNLQAASEVAERIRSSIARHIVNVYNVETRVTVSLGISLFPDDVPDRGPEYQEELAFELIRHADKALYRAKEEGRNRVFKFSDL